MWDALRSSLPLHFCVLTNSVDLPLLELIAFTLLFRTFGTSKIDQIQSSLIAWCCIVWSEWTSTVKHHVRTTTMLVPYQWSLLPDSSYAEQIHHCLNAVHFLFQIRDFNSPFFVAANF
jgi:hypothetical protein